MHRRAALSGGLAAISATALGRPANALGQCNLVGPGVQGCQVGIASPLIGRVANRQQASEWCWAASISMVFAYYGHNVSQTRIVQETWGGIANLPGQPQQILLDLNRPWTDDDGNSFMAHGDALSANAVTAAQDLNNDNPLLIGTMGHCMVLTAMAYLQDAYGRYQITALTVRDPWPFNPGQRVLSPQEFLSIQFLARIRVA